MDYKGWVLSIYDECKTKYDEDNTKESKEDKEKSLRVS